MGKPADPLVTPPHIVPEWHGLFAYTVLRAIPRKLGGVLGLVAAVIVVAVSCFSTGRWSVRCRIDPMRKNITWQFFASLHLNPARRATSGGAIYHPWPDVSRS